LSNASLVGTAAKIFACAPHSGRIEVTDSRTAATVDVASLARPRESKERSLQREHHRAGAGPIPVEQDEAVRRDERKRRILVVDDNRDAVESLAILLEMMNYDVRTAADGVEAVEATSAFSPDVVLLDIGLPRIDGYEAAQRIRALDGGSAVYLIALTGWGQDEDIRRSRDAGFDQHLVKPVDPDTLDALLRRATERSDVRGERPA
jgi:CheY-like chemotaxis protein